MGLSKQARDWFREQGSEGGKKAAKGMTKKERQERSRKAAQIRWATIRKAQEVEQ